MSAAAVLEGRGLTKRFGGLTAVDGVDLSVHAGEILGLIGPNGAGKSTLFNCLTGVSPPDEGVVSFRNSPLLAEVTPRDRGLLRCCALVQGLGAPLWAPTFWLGILPFIGLWDLEIGLAVLMLAIARLIAAVSLAKGQTWAWSTALFLAGFDGVCVLLFAIHLGIGSYPPLIPFSMFPWWQWPLPVPLMVGCGVLTVVSLVPFLTLPRRGLRSACGVHPRPDRICARGMARTFQNIRLFSDLSARDNVLVGAHLKGRSGMFAALTRLPAFHRDETALAKRADATLHTVGLSHRADEAASALPYGEQRRLEIARAIASEPALLLLDEPAAGMNATETEALGSLIRQLRDQGMAVLVIEHDMALIMELCDRVVVLDHGAKIADGSPAEVRRNPAVIAAYLGPEYDGSGDA